MTDVFNKVLDLKQGIVDVEFQKKDGTVTSRWMTLNSSLVNELKKRDDHTAEINPAVIKAWSITDNGWRAMKPHLIQRWTPLHKVAPSTQDTPVGKE